MYEKTQQKKVLFTERSISKRQQKPLTGRDFTRATTQRILDFFYQPVSSSQAKYQRKAVAWRENVLPIPLSGGRGFRPSAKRGLPDIMAILAPSGQFLGVEIKTGKDRLRPEQAAFHLEIRSVGGIVLVVKDFEDFLKQFEDIFLK